VSQFDRSVTVCRRRSHRTLGSGLVVALLAATGLAGFAAAPARAQVGAKVVLPHSTLVPETPATGYPMITQATGAAMPDVGATDLVGRHIVAGGKFTQVTLPDGTNVNRPWMTSWNIDTKQLECRNSTINGEVTAIEPGPTPNQVFIGGKFSKLSGPDGVVRTRPRLALLNLPDCSIDTTFVPPAPSAVVTDLKLLGNRLFVAGNFTSMGTTARTYLAEVNATTGALNPGFNLSLSKVQDPAVAGMGFNPAGTRLIVGGNLTGSVTRVIDISTPAAARLTAHASSGWPRSHVTDASVSTNGNDIALSYAPGAPSYTDDAVAVAPTTEAAVAVRWTHVMRDSPFSVAYSNNALYVGGHFCRPDAGPGATELMSVWEGTPSECTGSTIAGGVWRSHLAALSPTDGTPLAWNPGNQSAHGATALTVTTRGLLVGFDGERTHSIRTGALSFLDFGAGVEDTTPPSSVTFTAPTPGATLGNPARISGTASDNTGVDSFQVTVTSANGRYLQANGKLSTTPFAFPAAASGGSFTLDVPITVAGSYTASAVAVDAFGNTSVTPATVSFTDTAIDAVAPAATIAALTTPSATASTLSGTATDNVGVSSVALQVTDGAGQFLQADGSFAAAPATLPVTTTPAALPAASVTWRAAIPALAAGNYTATVTTKDAAGNPGTASGTVVATPGAGEIPGLAPLTTGTTVSFESVANPGFRVRQSAFAMVQSLMGAGSSNTDRLDSAYVVRAGLASAGALSFESASQPGYFLKVENGTLFLRANDGTAAFKTNATFVAVTGLAGAPSTSLALFSDQTVYLRAANNVVLAQTSDGSDQFRRDASFNVRAAMGPAAAFYQIKNGNSGLALTSTGTSNAPGTAVVQDTATVAVRREWELRDAGNGQYRLFNPASGLVLGISNASKTPGAGALVWTNTGAADHLWTIYPRSGRWMLKNVNSGLLLGINGASKATLAAAVQWTDGNNVDHFWDLIRQGPAATAGRYQIANLNSRLPLNTAANAITVGANVVQDTASGSTTQIWEVIDAGNGTFRIRQVGSGLLLTMATTTRGGTATVSTDTGTADRLWRLVPQNGHWIMVNANSNLVLGIGGMSTAAGAQALQWDDNGTADHLWDLNVR
jgi:Alpha-L-arabinofuranosidase B (ABFB) domain/Ricin-type beta-trefoil lectin domain-like